MDARSPKQTDKAGARARLGTGRPRFRSLRAGVLAVAAMCVLGALGYWVHDRFTHIHIDDARIAADVISVSSRVSGWTARYHVVEGDQVRAGDLLVSIDARDTLLRLQELDARLGSLAAESERLEAERRMADRQTASQHEVRRSQLAAAEASLAGRNAELEMAGTDYTRTQTLLDRNVVSRQRYEELRNQYLKAEQARFEAEAGVAAARAALVEAEAGRQRLTVLDKQIAILGHQRDEMAARRAQIELDLHDREIRSPIDGVIDRVFKFDSEYVSAGQRLLMVHDPDKVWVSANVKETDIRHIRRDTAVTVRVDAYPGEIFPGRVVRVGSAATSEFALLPTPNPSGNFTKIAQRLPLRIEVERNGSPLRPGMMVEVRIGIGDP